MNLNPTKWFAKKPTTDEKVQTLTERRDSLLSKVELALHSVPVLEAKDVALVEQGKATKQKSTQLRLAAEIKGIRATASRQRIQAKMFQNQADILSTDIQNLTIIENGDAVADLGLDSESLTENAVAAEEMLESLANRYGQGETPWIDCPPSSEELAIIAEFEEPEKESEKSEERIPETGWTLLHQQNVDKFLQEGIKEEPAWDSQVQMLHKQGEWVEGMTKEQAADRLGELCQNRADAGYGGEEF